MTIRCHYPPGERAPLFRATEQERLMHRNIVRETLNYKAVQVNKKWLSIHTHKFEEQGLDETEVKVLLNLLGYKTFHKLTKAERKAEICEQIQNRQEGK